MFKIHRFSPVKARRRGACALLLCAVALVSAPGPAFPCAGSHPPPPMCGKTLVLAKAMPGVVLPGAGTFNVPALVYFNLVDFPHGTGICPEGPYTVSVSLAATCSPGPGGIGTVSAPIVPGFNTVNVPVTVGAGGPRLCAVTGTASTILADGMTVTASGDTVACIAEPAPGNPSLPRLDMRVLGPAGSEIVRTHPGDQASYVVRITNNDPTRSFAGELSVEMVNSARLPGASGPMPAGTGVFSVSEPVQGDNFAIAFTEDLSEGCLSLPADPTDPAVPTLLQTIVLGPGESIDVEVFTRPWGMCADGSCGEATLVLEGEFSDLTPGIACAGLAVGADTSVEPAYSCPDSGQTVVVDEAASSSDTITLTGAPFPGSARSIDVETLQSQLFLGGLPSGAFFDLTSDAVDPGRGRTRTRFFPATVFDATASFTFSLEVDVRPSPGEFTRAELLQMAVILGAPTGFEDRAPVGQGLLELREESTGALDSYFNLTVQVNAVGVDEFGERHDLTFGSVSMSRKSDGSGFVVLLENAAAAPGTFFVFDEIELNQDVHGFVSPMPQSKQDEIFSNGFESGDTSSWTLFNR